MAQVKLYGRADRLRARREAWSEIVHASLVEAFGLPADKRFQRFIGLAPEDFVYPAGRSDDYTIVEIVLFEGRSVEAKKALYAAMYSRAAAAGIAAADLEITLIETPRHDWGIRGLPGDELELGYDVGA